MLDWLDHVQSGWQLLALIAILLSIIFAGPRLRAFLAPQDDDDRPAALTSAVPTASAELVRSLVEQGARLAAAEKRIAALETSTAVLVADRDLLAEATGVLVAWIDDGAHPPPPDIAIEVRALLARVLAHKETS